MVAVVNYILPQAGLWLLELNHSVVAVVIYIRPQNRLRILGLNHPLVAEVIKFALSLSPESLLRQVGGFKSNNPDFIPNLYTHFFIKFLLGEGDPDPASAGSG